MDFSSLVSIFTRGVMPFKTNLIGIISLLLFFIVFTKVCLPQNESNLDSLDGKFALQFQISDNFNLTNFQGTIFSGKYHFSNRDAVRLGISLDFGDSNYETDTDRDTLYSSNSKREVDRFGFSVYAQYIRYMEVTGDIAFFGGVGPFFHYSKENETRQEYYDTLNVKRESDRKLYSGGLDLLIGVEWWFHEYMSLSAEYGLSAYYVSTKDNSNQYDIKSSAKSHSFNISGSNVKFGITVYF